MRVFLKGGLNTTKPRWGRGWVKGVWTMAKSERAGYTRAAM